MQKLFSLELLIRPTIILLYMYIYLFVRPQQLRVLGYDQKGPSINIGEKIWLNLIIVVCAWRTTAGYSSFNKLLNGGIKLTLNRTNTNITCQQQSFSGLDWHLAKLKGYFWFTLSIQGVPSEFFLPRYSISVYYHTVCSNARQLI